MRRRGLLLLFAAASLAAVSLLDAQALVVKPKFTGTWQFAPDRSELKVWKPASLTLTIDHPDKAEIHFLEVRKESDGQERKRDYRCSTMGRDCDAGDSTLVTKVSMYYNGPKLVAIERMGKDSDTVQRRTYTLADDGNSLTIEIAQIVPPRAEIDKLVLLKLAESGTPAPAPPTAEPK